MSSHWHLKPTVSDWHGPGGWEPKREEALEYSRYDLSREVLGILSRQRLQRFLGGVAG